MKDVVKKINEIKNLANKIQESDKESKEVRNVREYDKYNAEKSVSLFDLESKLEDLLQSIKIKREVHDDMMSSKARQMVLNKIEERLKAIEL